MDLSYSNSKSRRSLLKFHLSQGHPSTKEEHLTVSLLSVIFGFPVEFALKYMIPGTAIGVLVGDLLFFWLAFRLAKKENRSDVCAMPQRDRSSRLRKLATRQR